MYNVNEGQVWSQSVSKRVNVTTKVAHSFFSLSSSFTRTDAFEMNRTGRNGNPLCFVASSFKKRCCNVATQRTDATGRHAFHRTGLLKPIPFCGKYFVVSTFNQQCRISDADSRNKKREKHCGRSHVPKLALHKYGMANVAFEKRKSFILNILV